MTIHNITAAMAKWLKQGGNCVERISYARRQSVGGLAQRLQCYHFVFLLFVSMWLHIRRHEIYSVTHMKKETELYWLWTLHSEYNLLIQRPLVSLQARKGKLLHSTSDSGQMAMCGCGCDDGDDVGYVTTTQTSKTAA